MFYFFIFSNKLDLFDETCFILLKLNDPQVEMATSGPDMNPDLAKERLNCPFSKEELTILLDGGPDKTAERRRVQKVYFEHPEVALELTIYSDHCL